MPCKGYPTRDCHMELVGGCGGIHFEREEVVGAGTCLPRRFPVLSCYPCFPVATAQNKSPVELSACHWGLGVGNSFGVVSTLVLFSGFCSVVFGSVGSAARAFQLRRAGGAFPVRTGREYRLYEGRFE